MTAPIIIAIDGTAASGKGTLARALARELKFAYLDTGKLYRYVGYRVVTNGGDPDDEQTAVRTAQEIALKPEDLADPALESDTAGKAASKVARFPGVRNALFLFQKNFAATPPNDAPGAVLDGRDIGTVICPDARAKFYITASTEVRAQRRFKELQSKGFSDTYDAVLADMRERDARDSGRDAAPMKAADDAVLLDTGKMTIAEVLDAALTYVRQRGIA